MKNKAYESLKAKIDLIEEEIDNIDPTDLESDIYELEDELTIKMQSCFVEDIHLFERLQRRINNIKKENDFYDAEGELDMMFPERHNEDFDEDSMSYDSIFGGD
ncbi:hypothetical protein [Lutibacter sp.]|uniref:hypothetical protein n=1 Tax=Lutibacter sp. TaxID=1925666 RepID=UPI001A295C1F|nr:hypothetical protein [Lutibacter sp.]MBI9041950.1 hypothetical protein [Lutibacter sp.]